MTFYWSFNSSQHLSKMANSHILQNGSQSQLTFRAEDSSYHGEVYCWGRNSIGVQEKPCRFVIYHSGNLYFTLILTCMLKKSLSSQHKYHSIKENSFKREKISSLQIFIWMTRRICEKTKKNLEGGPDILLQSKLFKMCLILEKPSLLENCQVMNTSRNDLAVNCDTPLTSFTSNLYIMEVYHEGNETSLNLFRNMSNTYSPYFIITGLKPSTSYSIQLYAVNNKGTGEKTSIIVQTGDSPKVESSRSK